MLYIYKIYVILIDGKYNYLIYLLIRKDKYK